MAPEGTISSPEGSAEPPTEASTASVAVETEAVDVDQGKVTVRFRPMGATKRLNTTLFRVGSAHDFSALVAFLRRKLTFTPQQSLFCYINASFSPALDAGLSDLAAAYSVDGVLNVYYCATVAFG